MEESRVVVASSTVSDGNMSPRWGSDAETAQSRIHFLTRHALENRHLILLSIPQPNGSTVQSVNQESSELIVADALISDDSSVVLGLFTADCVPLVCYDSTRCLFGLAHCGWESTHARLPFLFVQYFLQRSSAENLHIVLGPHIKKSSYSVRNDLVSQRSDARWDPFLDTHATSTQVDVAGYIVAQCVEAGIRREHVRDAPSDTYTDKTYFSHRRSKETGEPEGRMMTIVSLL